MVANLPRVVASISIAETAEEKQRRSALKADARSATQAVRHRQLTLEGLADVDAGRVIDDEAMRAWADSLGTDQEPQGSQFE